MSLKNPRRRKPAIGIIDSWFREPHLGSGTAVAVGGLSEALRNKGYDVIPISPTGHGRSLTLSRFLFNLRIMPRLLLSRPDVLVGIDWDGWIYSQVGSRPYVVSIKGVLADEMRFETGITKRLLEFQSKLEKLNLRRADRVITTSLYSKRRISELYGVPPAKIAVVPEGIDLASWRESLARARKNRRNVPKVQRGEVTVLCVAKQFPRKRIHVLLEAIASLKKDFPRLKLRVVGDGPEHDRLLKAAGRLGLGGSLLGALPRACDVVDEYARADIFCLPSVQEGFGIVFLEAMAAGLPIVACRAAAIPEVVENGKTGLLARPEDANDLALQLRRLIEDRNLRERIGARGLKAVGNYSWDKVATLFAEAAF